jgi:triacylglycerol esterase/lipase EstA (alpha/beta hydrolase family)
MPKVWSAQEERKQREEQKQIASKELSSYAGKLRLLRPVYFVPGWTYEFSECWTSPYLTSYVPIKRYVTRLFSNYDQAFFITFSLKESKGCKSFLDFGALLKEKIRKQAPKNGFDLVGHSMGGLDSIAAITNEQDPLTGVINLITAATPHRGSEWGEMCLNHDISNWRKLKPHQVFQGVNLDPDQHPIQQINTVQNRQKLINSLNKLYCLGGTRDMAVFGSSKFNVDGLTDAQKAKVDILEPYGGAQHSETWGITQDPRAMRDIVRILVAIPLEKPKMNEGIVS